MASAHRYSWTLADGRRREGWRAKWIGPDGRQRSKRGFDLQGSALDWAQDREVEARHGVTLEGERLSGKTTVSAWARTWLAAQDVRASTLESYGTCVGRIERTIGGRTLSALRPSEIKAWRRGLGATFADSTASQTASILGMILHSAVADGLLERSPMPTMRSAAGERRVVDPEELLTLEQVRAWDAALPRHARGMAIVAASTGLRQGELLGLQPADVDWLRGSLRVRRQLVTLRGSGPVYGPPKTTASERTVPLPALAHEALAAYLAAFPAVEGEPLFRNSKGGRWRRDAFGQTWTKARDRAEWTDRSGKQPVRRVGLPAWAHWHALRDVAASALIWSGTEMKTVMAIMGHSSPDETYKTYGRLWPEAQDTARKALDAVWASSVAKHVSF